MTQHISSCLVSSHVKNHSYQNSIRAQDYNFFRIQYISRKVIKLIGNSKLIDKFERICEVFTFVYAWNYPQMTPEKFRIYARNVPAKEAS